MKDIPFIYILIVSLGIAILISSFDDIDQNDRLDKLEEHMLIYHVDDSDNWAETAHSLDIHPDSMTMAQFKEHHVVAVKDAPYRH